MSVEIPREGESRKGRPIFKGEDDDGRLVIVYGNDDDLEVNSLVVSVEVDIK